MDTAAPELSEQKSLPRLLGCLHLSTSKKSKCETCGTKSWVKFEDSPIAPCFNEEREKYCSLCGTFKKIIATKYCKNCCCFVCSIHEQSHKLTERSQHHELLEIKDSLDMLVLLKCRKHGEPITTYCFTCNKPTCEVCLIIHLKHKIRNIEESTELEVMKIGKEKDDLAAVVVRDQVLLEEAETTRNNLIQSRNVTLDTIDNCIKSHILALEKRRVILRKQVDELAGTRLLEIDEKIRQFKLHRDRCKEACDFSKKAIDFSGDEIVEFSSTILQRFADLRMNLITACKTSSTIYLYTSDDMENPYSQKYILELGRICDGSPRKIFKGAPSREEIDGDAMLWKRIFHQKFPEEVEWKWNMIDKSNSESESDSESVKDLSSSDDDEAIPKTVAEVTDKKPTVEVQGEIRPQHP